MAQLTVNSNSILGAYRNASKDTRKVLEEIFGSQVKLSSDITDQVASFEDACDILEYSSITPMCGQLPDKYHGSIKAFYMLQVTCEALNEGWEADWNNTDQVKYFPYFRLVNGKLEYAGVAARLSFLGFGLAYASSVSRLCLKDEKTAEYMGKQFTELYNDYIMPNN